MAEPVRGRQLRVRWAHVPALPRRAFSRQRDPRPRSLGGWTVAERQPIASCWSTRCCRSRAIRSRSPSRIDYSLSTRRARGADDGDERRRGCRAPSAPVLIPTSPSARRVSTPRVAGAARTPCCTPTSTGCPIGSGPVDGTPFDFREARPIGATKLDTAFTELVRDGDGLARVELRHPERAEASGCGSTSATAT